MRGHEPPVPPPCRPRSGLRRRDCPRRRPNQLQRVCGGAVARRRSRAARGSAHRLGRQAHRRADDAVRDRRREQGAARRDDGGRGAEAPLEVRRALRSQRRDDRQRRAASHPRHRARRHRRDVPTARRQDRGVPPRREGPDGSLQGSGGHRREPPRGEGAARRALLARRSGRARRRLQRTCSARSVTASPTSPTTATTTATTSTSISRPAARAPRATCSSDRRG